MMTDLISKYLLTYSAVKIPGFGTFLQKNSQAFYDEKSAALLPPAKELFFEVYFDLRDEDFAQFFATQKNLSLSESHAKIKEFTDYWKSTLEDKNELEIPELGNFFVNDTHLVFKGKRFSTANPDNFGLEEVNLAQLKKKLSVTKKPSTNDYKTSSNKFWWLLLIIPTAAIVYFATQNPELIFGKKSFKSLNKIQKTSVGKKDNLKQEKIKTDSISIKNNANAKK